MWGVKEPDWPLVCWLSLDFPFWEGKFLFWELFSQRREDMQSEKNVFNEHTPKLGQLLPYLNSGHYHQYSAALRCNKYWKKMKAVFYYLKKMLVVSDTHCFNKQKSLFWWLPLHLCWDTVAVFDCFSSTLFRFTCYLGLLCNILFGVFNILATCRRF